MSLSHCYFICILLIAISQSSLQLPQLKPRIRENEKCECGKPSDEIANRIVGGEIVQSNSYPWMAAIFYNQKFHCGGSLINDRYILTAGHCLNGINKEDLQVVLGKTDLYTSPQENVTDESAPEIDRTVVHEEFSSDYLHDMDDLGLIRLKKPVVYNDKIIPICMPKRGSNYDSLTALVTGWGRTDEEGHPSGMLRKAYLKVMTNEDCRNISSIGDHITDTMLCAYESDTDACQGDSGGPLVIENEGKMEQIGIVSWGIGCAKPGIPGVYARMTSYLDWLMQHTQDGVYCKNK